MKNRFTGRLDGFTLIELLVVVLIIGILSAVALPKYQGAVDKSRYSTLMPMAKTIANSQEAFYMASGDYSQDLQNLDIAMTKDATGPTAELSDGTKLELSQRESHKYVKLSKDNLENNYIVYQNHSPNYAKEIHCEALQGSSRAERLCEGLGGEKINGYLTPGYDTYVLEGSGLGMSADVVDAMDKAGDGGWQSCDTYPCTKTCNRDIKAGYTCNGTYQEDGSYTERSCQRDVCVEKSFGEDGKMDKKRTCVMNGDVCESQREYTYDENGNQTSWHFCSAVGSDGSCTEYNWGFDYTYDENGNQTSNLHCKTFGSDGKCTAYDNAWYYTYDANGNQTSQRNCKTVGSDGKCTAYRSGQDYTYDANGNRTSSRICKTFGSDGSCTAYSSGYYYTYDANGNQTSQRNCKTVGSDGSCTGYGSGTDYTYDANGNRTSSRTCKTFGSDGSCTAYASWGNYDYTYDANGNKTSERECITRGSDGKCTEYDRSTEYFYDANGNKTSERDCGYYEDGSCTEYKEYTYDTNGNKTSERNCKTVGSDGSCTAYASWGNYDYTYDEEGKQTSIRDCSAFDSDGNCTSWGSYSNYY